MSIRPVLSRSGARPILEGSWMHLHRTFRFREQEPLDPFPLFDDFRNDLPELCQCGFRWHPHRGIETVTRLLAGTVEHGDGLGNRGTLGAGDVQWMRARSGMFHPQMPRGDAEGQMHGFRPRAKLPSHLRVTAPRCRDV